MESLNKIHVNTIVWASNIDKAVEIASKFTNGVEKDNKVFAASLQEYNMNTYVRSLDAFSSAAPTGIADIVIIYLASEDSSDFSDAKKYLDSRKGIPIRVLTSENTLLDQASSLDCKFVSLNGLLGDERETIIKEARKLEETLLNCFKKFDVNGNGLISVEELIKVSGELGHELSFDDAKMIVDTLDPSKANGVNISFDGFKKWWVQGKSDFVSFRRLCKAEMSINNLIKLTSRHFNEYLSNLKGEAKSVSEQELSQQVDINLHSKRTFENGLGVYLEIFKGTEAVEIIKSKPDHMKDSPVGFSIRVNFDSNETAEGLAAMLSQLVPAMLQSVPQLEQILNLGLCYTFRASGTALIAEVYVQGMLVDMIQNQADQFNFGEVNISASLTFHLFTALTLQNLIISPAIELLQNASHLKFHLNYKTFNLRNAIPAICELLEKQIESQNIPSVFRTYIIMLRAGAILRSLNLDFSYDPLDFIETLIEFGASVRKRYSDESFETCKETFVTTRIQERIIDEFRNKYNETKSTVSEMKQMIPEEFIPIIKSIDLNKLEFELFMSHPQAALLLKLNLHLPGLNAIRDELLSA